MVQKVYLEIQLSVLFSIVDFLIVLYLLMNYLQKCCKSLSASNEFLAWIYLNYCIQYLYFQNTISPSINILLNRALIPNWLNRPFAFCLLANIGFLLLHTVHFDKSIILSSLSFEAFRFLLSVFFLYGKQYENTFL